MSDIYRRDKWDALWTRDGDEWARVNNPDGSPVNYFNNGSTKYSQIGAKQFEAHEDPSDDLDPYPNARLERLEDTVRSLDLQIDRIEMKIDAIIEVMRS